MATLKEKLSSQSGKEIFGINLFILYCKLSRFVTTDKLFIVMKQPRLQNDQQNLFRKLFIKSAYSSFNFIKIKMAVPFAGIGSAKWQII
jgi:hypothetical protein